MALKFMDGFDAYSAFTDLAVRNVTIASTPTFSSSTGRFGTGCVGGNSVGDSYTFPVPALDASTGKLHWAAYIKFTTLPAASTKFFDIRNSADANGGAVYCDNTGQIGFTQYNGSVTWTFNNVFNDLGWHHIEVEAKYNNTGSLKVWIDGILQINTGSVDTFNSGTPATTNIAVASVPNTMTFLIDDLVIWDEIGTDFVLAPMGEHRILTRYPSADTAQKQFTASTGTDNYAMVDDAGMHDGDTTYVQSTTIGHEDLYDVTDMGVTPLSIFAVAVNTRAKKTDTGAVTMKNHLKSGATDSAGAAAVLSGSYAQYADYYGKDPNGTIAWTAAAVDAAQIGFKYEA